MKILKVLIPKGEMPESCLKRKYEMACEYIDYKTYPMWCILCDKDIENCINERHPDCPLEEVEE